MSRFAIIIPMLLVAAGAAASPQDAQGPAAAPASPPPTTAPPSTAPPPAAPPTTAPTGTAAGDAAASTEPGVGTVVDGWKVTAVTSEKRLANGAPTDVSCGYERDVIVEKSGEGLTRAAMKVECVAGAGGLEPGAVKLLGLPEKAPPPPPVAATPPPTTTTTGPATTAPATTGPATADATTPATGSSTTVAPAAPAPAAAAPVAKAPTASTEPVAPDPVVPGQHRAFWDFAGACGISACACGLGTLGAAACNGVVFPLGLLAAAFGFAAPATVIPLGGGALVANTTIAALLAFSTCVAGPTPLLGGVCGASGSSFAMWSMPDGDASALYALIGAIPGLLIGAAGSVTVLVGTAMMGELGHLDLGNAFSGGQEALQYNTPAIREGGQVAWIGLATTFAAVPVSIIGASLVGLIHAMVTNPEETLPVAAPPSASDPPLPAVRPTVAVSSSSASPGLVEVRY